jgi:FMN phosphatase YigB (HAD superfamily)
MIKAILFDMDETLVQLDADQFAAFLGKALVKTALQQYPAHDPKALGEGFNRALATLSANLDPTRTNTEIYGEAIATELNLTPAEVLSLSEKFYGEGGTYLTFPGPVSAVPGAALALNTALARGYAVVIATLPIFPRPAIVQRLKWAGLDSTLPFKLITDIDQMHFYKGHPHYYEEILARLGVDADEAIMVGNNPVEDTLPAQKAGLNTFWIGETLPDGLTPDGHGTLEDFTAKLADGWLNTLTARPNTPAQLEPRFRGNIAAAFSIIAEMPDEFWNQHPDPQEWSPLEIICHLRDRETQVQRPRLERILNEDNPFLTPPKEPPAPGECALSSENGKTALYQWWDERCQTIAFLNSLPPEAFARPARHSIFGPTTLLEMANFTARHDRLHLTQLQQTLRQCK